MDRLIRRSIPCSQSGWPGWRGPPGTLHQAGVHDDSHLDLQPAGLYLSVDHVQQRLGQTLLVIFIAKTADSGLVRYLMMQGKPAEMAEGNTILQVFR